MASAVKASSSDLVVGLEAEIVQVLCITDFWKPYYFSLYKGCSSEGIERNLRASCRKAPAAAGQWDTWGARTSKIRPASRYWLVDTGKPTSPIIATKPELG